MIKLSEQQLFGIKPCSQCEEFRILEEFYAHPTAKDGLQPICKYCQKENTTRYRDKNPVCPWGLQDKELDRLVKKQVQLLQDMCVDLH